jgi:hypothetical protein
MREPQLRAETGPAGLRPPLEPAGSVLGWHVLETNDMTALAEHVNNWDDLIDIELNPIVEDTQAAEAAARVFGK